MNYKEHQELYKNDDFRAKMKALAHELGTDGCTFPASQLYVVACWEHDIAYHVGLDPTDLTQPITRREADKRLRWGVEHLSPTGRLSPLAKIRWAFVRSTGWVIWNRREKAGWPEREIIL